MISVVIITKNAEGIIADCLDSLSFCDEIIVVDNESDDKTVEIAEKIGARIFSLKTDDFSKLRNLGLEKAKGDWILYIDADERIDKKLAKEIEHLAIDNDRRQELNGFFLKRKNFYFGSSKKNEWPFIEHLERLFKKDKLEGWYGKLHESPKIKGKMGELDGYLLHYSHKNLTAMLLKTIEWSKIEADLRYKSGHPKMTWWRFIRVMFTAFFDSYVRQSGWKVGVIGIIESLYQSFSIFVTYARLWEMQQKEK